MTNVFELSLPAGKIESFSLNFVVENSSMIIVNVTNPDAITFKNGSMSINGVGLENRSIGAKVVFNFPKAKTINATGFEFIWQLSGAVCHLQRKWFQCERTGDYWW